MKSLLVRVHISMFFSVIFNGIFCLLVRLYSFGYLLLLPIALRTFQFGLGFPYNWCPFLSIQCFRSPSSWLELRTFQMANVISLFHLRGRLPKSVRHPLYGFWTIKFFQDGVINPMPNPQLSWRTYVFCRSTASVIDEWISMELCWNDSERRKPQSSEETLSQCHFTDHKSHIDWPGSELWPPRWEASD
jgi:hypothetical protein